MPKLVHTLIALFGCMTCSFAEVYGQTITDLGCCILWRNANKLSVKQYTLTTAGECANIARIDAATINEYDFFRRRDCSQAVRCRDTACTNLASEPVTPIQPPKIQ